MAELMKTPLHGLHEGLGARMVEFAGYDMPLQYPGGILKEHLHTRAAAGLFDVSHMGQVEVRAKSGEMSDAAAALEALMPIDVLGLAEGRQRYGLFTDAAGGILDDLMVANRGEHFLLVVNAGRKAEDLAHLEAGLGGACTVEVLDRALIALQGPRAEAALGELNPDVAGMRFMDVRAVDFSGVPAVVSRSGYTGEDGYEIAVEARHAVDIAARLLAIDGVAPVGLGARDSLRLEAGLCLYGHDIDATTTPVEAALEWAIQPARRQGGARAGGFPGAEVILGQIAAGAARRRVGLLAGGAGADAGRHGALRRGGGGGGGRDHLGRVRAEPRRAGGHGLRGGGRGGAGHPALRAVAREDAACNSGEDAAGQGGLQAGVSEGETRC